MNAVVPASMAIFARARAARDGFCRAAGNDRRQRIAASARRRRASERCALESRWSFEASRCATIRGCDLSRARISYAQTVTHQNPPATARGTSANSESTPPRATPSSDARRRACRARARDATRAPSTIAPRAPARAIRVQARAGRDAKAARTMRRRASRGARRASRRARTRSAGRARARRRRRRRWRRS